MIKFLSYFEAKKVISKFKIKSETEWRAFIKTDKFPDNIPKAPGAFYKKSNDWEGWGDFLDTNNFYSYDKSENAFKKSREFVWTLGISNKKEWFLYCKSGKKPSHIPADPKKVYKKFFLSYEDWFGTKKNFNGYCLYDEAEFFAHSLNLKSNYDWRKIVNSENFPHNIPHSPDVYYRNKGWKSWGIFLNTNNKHKSDYNFITYVELKNLILIDGVKNQKEYYNWYINKKDDIRIPRNPDQSYKGRGWTNWYLFTGTLGNGEHQWQKSAIISYLEEAKNFIHVCSIPVLLTIIESNGLYNILNKEQLKKLQESLPDSKQRENVVAEILNEFNKKSDEEIKNSNSDIESELSEVEIKELLNEKELENDSVDNTELRIKQLRELEKDFITASLDHERFNFLINDSINNLWYDTLANKLDITRLNNELLPGTIKNKFLNEYEEVNKMQLPKGWKYPYKPLLMQKLISYKLKINKQYGNWSGAGSGKTISAILAGRYVDAKNTLIITFNSTIGTSDTRGWTKEIKDSFPDSHIYTKFNKNIKFKNSGYNYLILNYETFQQGASSAEYVISLLKNNKFDYIVLDEVHSIKQRDNNESQRRQVIAGLIGEVRKLNKNYYLLAMSATPVINNLTEAKSLLELITFRKLDDVKTNENIPNCIELFRRLVTHGIRHKNVEDNILKNNEHTIIDIDGSELFSEAKIIEKDDIISRELLVLNKKLEAIEPYINTSIGKTVIYTHYVAGMEDVIYDFLTAKGFKVGVYTGGTSKFNREQSISDFIDGKYDVFLGSRPIGTGVDGLQKICDREIILSLPWTSAELYQLERRVNRKGSKFKETGMDVIIPMVSISNGKKSFTWDKDRYNMITYKATIANAVVDGIIPEKIMPPKEELIISANDKMPEWINRLKNDNILTAEREELKTNLFLDISASEEVSRQKIESELSELNRIGKITLSKTMHKKFTSKPDIWHRYHLLRNESMKTWEEIPYKYIASKIKSKKDVVVDFGCGMNEFKLCIPNNKVLSFDHIAVDDAVIACDMRDISKHVKNESVNVCVFSLSLWGTNYHEYIKESYRILTYRGIIYIAEPLLNNDEQQKIVCLLNDSGFDVIGEVEQRGKFSYISAIKV